MRVSVKKTVEKPFVNLHLTLTSEKRCKREGKRTLCKIFRCGFQWSFSAFAEAVCLSAKKTAGVCVHVCLLCVCVCVWVDE